MADYISTDPVHRRIMEGMAVAAANAVERARQHGTKLAFWEDGKVVQVDPDTITFPKKQCEI